jgi:hypothetical protein
LLVQDSVAEELMAKLRARIDNFRIGHSLEKVRCNRQ